VEIGEVLEEVQEDIEIHTQQNHQVEEVLQKHLFQFQRLEQSLQLQLVLEELE